MSKLIKLSKFKKYIKETYAKLGEINYSNYWNLGYINALKDNEIINGKEVGILSDCNDKAYLDEKMKVIFRKKIICKNDEGLHPIVYENED